MRFSKKSAFFTVFIIISVVRTQASSCESSPCNVENTISCSSNDPSNSTLASELCSVKNHPQRGNDSLQIASFNIQIFGDTKVGKVPVSETLVEIFNMFDLVAVQEIRDADLSGINTFMNTYRI